jgi:hypothetical protein
MNLFKRPRVTFFIAFPSHTLYVTVLGVQLGNLIFRPQVTMGQSELLYEIPDE